MYLGLPSIANTECKGEYASMVSAGILTNNSFTFTNTAKNCTKITNHK